jgi:hypothetical protein
MDYLEQHPNIKFCQQLEVSTMEMLQLFVMVYGEEMKSQSKVVE